MAPSNVEPGLLALLTKHCSSLGSSFTSRGSGQVIASSDAGPSRVLFAKSVSLSSKRQADQILGEAASLDAMHEACLKAGQKETLIPSIHAWGEDKDSSRAFLITDYRDMKGGLSSSAQSKLGAKLAQMHLNGTSSNGKFGFDRPTHCGVTEQDNDWNESWPDFWAERRIGEIIRRLGDQEITVLEQQMRQKVYPLIFKAFDDAKEPIRPAIIHGDLWSGNAGEDMKTGEPVIFDPSSYYAHSEAELGIMRMFGGFSSPFFDAYHKLIPKLEPYHEERVQNYELYHHLNHALMFGGGYRSGATRIMKRLIAWADKESQSLKTAGGTSELPRRIAPPRLPHQAFRLSSRRSSTPVDALRILPSLLSFFLPVLLLLALPTLISATPSASASASGTEGLQERFDERLTMRSLQDGRVQALFEFDVVSESSPFPSVDDDDDHKGTKSTGGAAHSHFSLLPRPLLQAAKLGGAKEVFLSMNSGRWDFAKWGNPVVFGPDAEDGRMKRRGEWNVGSGAEVWARLENDEGDEEEERGGRVASLMGVLNGTETMSTSSLSRSSMTKWRRLMASLAGLFCASLDGIDERLTTSPRVAYSSPHSVEGGEAQGKLLHAFLPSEQICTENLTPFLKLLPCKSSAGLASLLEPHKLFAADFHGMTVRLRKGREGWEMRLGFQAVFSPAVGVWSFKRDWSFKKLFNRRLEASCPLATSSWVHVLRPQDDSAPSETECSGWPKPPYSVTPLLERHVSRLEQAERKRYGYEEEDEDDEMRLERAVRRPFRMAEVVKRDGEVAYDVMSVGEGELRDGLDVEMRWTEEVDYEYPSQYVRPPLTATRQLIGAGQESGTLRLVLRNDDKLRERRAVYFEVLPWFIQPSLHSLKVTARADEFDEESDDLVRYVDDLTSPLLLNLSYDPSIARIRPFLLEATLRIPPSSTVELTMGYDKAFLRYTEHPPDAHRGFDLPPAVVWLVDERSKEKGDRETPRIYTAPALVELAVPDFSMPYNVIIFTSTIVALCLGSALNNLVRTYKDVVSVAPQH